MAENTVKLASASLNRRRADLAEAMQSHSINGCFEFIEAPEDAARTALRHIHAIASLCSAGFDHDVDKVQRSEFDSVNPTIKSEVMSAIGHLAAVADFWMDRARAEACVATGEAA